MTAADLTMTVDDGTAFIDDTHYIILGDDETEETLADDTLKIIGEIIKVTNIAGNNLTITRGVGGSTATVHADGANIYELDGIPHDGFNGTDEVQQWNRIWAIHSPANITVENIVGDNLTTVDLLEGRANGVMCTAISILETGLAEQKSGFVIAERG